MLLGDALTKMARRKPILSEVSFEIESGSTTTILGPSGSGKTTLLRTIMGLDRLDGGKLYLDDRCLSGKDIHVPPQEREMSLVFQEFTLFPNLDVAANVAFGLKHPGRASGEIDQFLELLEIQHLKHRRIDKLSGGEQQRVALARALAVRPRVLLMDEPFSNIDNMLRERLYERLRERLAAAEMTTLIATHDHKEAFYFSDTIMVLKDGVVIDHNAPKRIYEQPKNAWAAAFFGDTNILDGRVLKPLLNGRAHLLSDGVRYLVRPEMLELGKKQDSLVCATIQTLTYFGTHQDVRLRLDSGDELQARCPVRQTLEIGASVGIRVAAHFEPHPVAAQ